MRVFVLASAAASLRSFRGDLILELLASGYEVIACAPNLIDSKETIDWLELHNVKCVNAPFSRAGLSPIRDVSALLKLTKIIRKYNPDIFFAYTIKPVIWGGIAARLAGVSKRVALITGLGYAFTGRAMGKRKIVQYIARLLYRVSLQGMHQIFFQNPDDKSDFAKYKLLSDSVPIYIINGSGVDTSKYSFKSNPKLPIKFLLIARLLGDKGIREYAAAAARIKSYIPDVEFHLVGGLDPNPAGLSECEVNNWHAENILCWHGTQSDVRPFIENCHVFVLPSYREGTPRAVLEAMSMGRAIITTDAPGCRETVINGKNGYLVEVQSVDSLVDAMKKFIEAPEIIESMGKASRTIAVEKYDVQKVNAFLLSKVLN